MEQLAGILTEADSVAAAPPGRLPNSRRIGECTDNENIEPAQVPSKKRRSVFTFEQDADSRLVGQLNKSLENGKSIKTCVHPSPTMFLYELANLCLVFLKYVCLKR